MFLLYSPTLPSPTAVSLETYSIYLVLKRDILPYPPLPYRSFFRNLLHLFSVKEGHVYLRLQMTRLTREILVEELLLIIFQLIYWWRIHG